MREIEVKKELSELASQNVHVSQHACFLGAGAYNHWIPSAVDHIISRSEFYTAYTPYQPEISQGTLQSIFEFQSWICQLAGLDVANASLYDGATAMAEAALMAIRLTKKQKVVLLGDIHPAYKQVLETYLEPLGVEIGNCELGIRNYDGAAAVIVQQPSFLGDVVGIDDLRNIAQVAHDNGALFITCIDPISLGILPRPVEYGADIVIGEGQGLGIPLSYGGPYLGFMSCKSKLLRQMPGRIVGETVDKDGEPGFVLTMQTREQHIRREKATSNICSNQALCALAATVYLSLIQEKGLKEVATVCKKNSEALKNRLSRLDGYKIMNKQETFKEFVLETPLPVSMINRALLEKNILGGYELEKNKMLVAVTEMLSEEQLDLFVDTLITCKESSPEKEHKAKKITLVSA